MINDLDEFVISFRKNEEKKRIRLNHNSKRHYEKHITDARRIKRENYRKDVIESKRSKKRIYALKYEYNLSVSDYEKLLSEQENKCAICGKEFTKEPCVDHDHKTEKVRGLLCLSCNANLGYYEKVKERMVSYLEKSKLKQSQGEDSNEKEQR